MDANQNNVDQKQMGELNNALDDIAIARQSLFNKKKVIDQQVKTLNQEKRKQQRALLRLKSANVFKIIMFNLFAVILSCAILSYIDTRYIADKDALRLDYEEQISTLDDSLNDLMQQRNDLQDTLVQQEQAIRLGSLKDQVASQSEHSDAVATILTEDTRKELDTYIASLNRYPSQRVKQKEFDGVSYYEVVQKYDLGQYMLNDSGNPTIYPGAILRGDSLMQGTSNCALVSQERTPITLVCSHTGNSIRLENVSYGTVKEAVGQLWNKSNREYAEKWEYSIHSVQNEESLNVSLGIGSGSFSSSLGVTQTETTSTIAITFTETYFSVAAEPMSSATQYFQTGCDLKSLGSYEPAYVSSVDYGRRIVVLVATELSESEIKSKLAANIYGVDISADIGYIKKEIDSNCKIYCYGGDSAKTLQAIGNDEGDGGLKKWWNELINGKSNDVNDLNQMIIADDSLINPVPLAYHLNYLSDNSSVPAVMIMSDNIILAETARLVTFTLEGNLPGVFRLSDSANAIGYVVNTNQIQITKKGKTSGEIQFIWDSSNPASLTGYFNDDQFSCSLADIPKETDYKILLRTDDLFKSTNVHIYISDAIYEIP